MYQGAKWILLKQKKNKVENLMLGHLSDIFSQMRALGATVAIHPLLVQLSELTASEHFVNAKMLMLKFTVIFIKINKHVRTEFREHIDKRHNQLQDRR